MPADVLTLPAAQLRLLVAIAASWRVAKRAPLQVELDAAGIPMWPAPALEAKGLINGARFSLPGQPTLTHEARDALAELSPERRAA